MIPSEALPRKKEKHISSDEKQESSAGIISHLHKYIYCVSYNTYWSNL